MAFDAGDALLDVDVVLVLAKIIFVAVDAQLVWIFKKSLLAVRIVAVGTTDILSGMTGKPPFAQRGGVAGAAVFGVRQDRDHRGGMTFNGRVAVFASHTLCSELTGGDIVACGVADQALAGLAQRLPALDEDRVGVSLGVRAVHPGSLDVGVALGACFRRLSLNRGVCRGSEMRGSRSLRPEGAAASLAQTGLREPKRPCRAPKPGLRRAGH